MQHRRTRQLVEEAGIPMRPSDTQPLFDMAKEIHIPGRPEGVITTETGLVPSCWPRTRWSNAYTLTAHKYIALAAE